MSLPTLLLLSSSFYNTQKQHIMQCTYKKNTIVYIVVGRRRGKSLGAKWVTAIHVQRVVDIELLKPNCNEEVAKELLNFNKMLGFNSQWYFGKYKHM